MIWLALLVAPFAEQGLAEVLINSDKILKDPFDIRICEGSLKTAALFLAVYIMSICIYHTSRRNYRKGEEHGSAEWGDPSAVDRKYHQRPDTANKLLTQHVRIGIDGRKHRRNLNVLVCGGSGLSLIHICAGYLAYREQEGSCVRETRTKKWISTDM